MADAVQRSFMRNNEFYVGPGSSSRSFRHFTKTVGLSSWTPFFFFFLFKKLWHVLATSHRLLVPRTLLVFSYGVPASCVNSTWNKANLPCRLLPYQSTFNRFNLTVKSSRSPHRSGNFSQKVRATQNNCQIKTAAKPVQFDF